MSACLALSEEKSTQHFVAKADSAGGGVYYAGSQNKHPSNMRRNTICLTTAVCSNNWSFDNYDLIIVVRDNWRGGENSLLDFFFWQGHFGKQQPQLRAAGGT